MSLSMQSSITEKDITYMRVALEEAKLAYDRDEVPIGAVIVDRQSGEIVARNGNRTIEMSDPSAHAEILCVREVCDKLGVQRFPEYDLYVTLEPCPMCAAALSYARVARVVYGASDVKSGGISSDIKLYERSQIHHKPEVVHGALEQECGEILKSFFAAKRK